MTPDNHGQTGTGNHPVVSSDWTPNVDTGLNPAQETAARMIAYGASSKHAGDAVGRCERQIQAWRQLPEFRRFVWTLLSDVRQEAMGVLHAHYKVTMNRVVGLVQSEDEKVALAAARLHHEMQTGLITIQQLQEQQDQMRAELDELKARLK